jgi:Bacterial Ig-like domain (group 3)
MGHVSTHFRSATVLSQCYLRGYPFAVPSTVPKPSVAAGRSVDRTARLTKSTEKAQSMPFLSSNRISEELHFVSTLFCTNGPVSRALVSRILALPLAVLALAAFSSALAAQTAPQLLPYLPKVLAGGGAAIASGAPCHDASGNSATDAFGDNCLATSVLLSSPRYAVTDSAGNIFFSDYTSAVSLIRRIDAVTGIVTLVAGNPSTPAIGAACPGLTGAVALDVKGDGCLANTVNLFNPEQLLFAANGDLYFVENGNQDVRKITATGGLITTTGVISLVAGNSGKTSGYAVNQGGTNITVGPGSTTSLLDFPAAIAFDKAGNLYITDEGNQAIEVVNLTSATETIQGVSVPAGTIAKLAGEGNAQTKVTTGECPNAVFVSTNSRGGCAFGSFADGAPAVTSNLDSPYGIALDSTGNIYFDNEFPVQVGKISAGAISNFAGNSSSVLYTAAKPFPRGPAGSFSIGSNFGLAIDPHNNTYITDALNGAIWRVDASGTMYLIAGGSFTPPTANNPCPGASTFTSTDAFGDGCPGPSSVFGHSGTSFASTTAPGPGIYGVSVDAFSNLYVGDSETALVREVANGTSLGTKGNSTVLVHYVSGDSPAANAYVTTGPFTATPGNCVPNTDGTSDCPVTITGTATALGPYSGVLTITSTKGGSATYPLSGIFAPTPVTHTAVSFSVGAACGGATTIAVGASVKLNAVVSGNGNPTGSVQFFANGTAVGTPQTLTNGQANFTFTPGTAATFTITATYSGDSYYTASTGTAAGTFVTSNPTFTTALLPTMQSTVVAGQTALYSASVTQSVYTGTIAFACTGLPAFSSCAFSPATITATGCSTTSVVALSILTQQATSGNPAGLGVSGNGRWTAFAILPGVLLALFVGIRRRKSPLRYGQVWLALALLLTTSGLMACGKSGNTTAATPSGTFTVTVQATGSAGTITSFTVPLTVK